MRKIGRRTFIKTTIVGASGLCGFEPLSVYFAHFSARNKPYSIKPETFEICHQVRDHFPAIPVPAASRDLYDVAVVGGGPSGLTAAYRLRDRNLLLLEKEGFVGGNCSTDSWEGIPYTLGGIYVVNRRGPAARLFHELDLRPVLLPPDLALLPSGRYVELGPALAESLSGTSTGALRKLQERISTVDIETEHDRLDRQVFSSFLGGVNPAEQTLLDGLFRVFHTEPDNISALAGVMLCRTYLFLQPSVEKYGFAGGLGPASEELAKRIEKAHPGSILLGASVYRISNAEDGSVHVSFLRHRKAFTIRSRVVIAAAPKFFIKHIIPELPSKQFQAMAQIEASPVLLIAYCLDRAIFDRAYNLFLFDGGPIGYLTVNGLLGLKKVSRDAPEVLTCVLHPTSRVSLLSQGELLETANRTLDILDLHFPGAREHTREIRVYPKGHAAFVPVIGLTSEIQPMARQPVGRIVFAHSDSMGHVSEFDSAILAAERAVSEAQPFLS